MMTEPNDSTEPTDEIDEAPETEEVSPEAARIAELVAETAKLKDQLLRTLAEQENLRERTQREVEDSRRYAVTNFAKELVATADNLRRAIETVPDPDAAEAATKQLLDGIIATERVLLAAFEKASIRRIHPLHEPFDHNLHQALFEVEQSGHPPGTVVQVLQPGYVIHDRLLREAMVGVAKGEAGAPKPDPKKAEAYQRIDTKV